MKYWSIKAFFKHRKNIIVNDRKNGINRGQIKIEFENMNSKSDMIAFQQ